MAQQEVPAIQNTKLLIVAAVLGVIVVVIYQVQVYQIRAAGREDKVKLLRLARELAPGEQLKKIGQEVVAVEVPESVAEGYFSKVVKASEFEAIRGDRVRKAVKGNDWLRWRDLTGGQAAGPAEKITRGKVAVTVPVDPFRSQGEMLRIGDKVNMCAFVRDRSGRVEPYRIISALKVLAIGGRWAGDTEPGAATPSVEGGLRAFKSVTVELTPQTSLALNAVLSNVVGSVWLELRHPDQADTAQDEQIHPALQSLTARAPGRP